MSVLPVPPGRSDEKVKTSPLGERCGLESESGVLSSAIGVGASQAELGVARELLYKSLATPARCDENTICNELASTVGQLSASVESSGAR